MYKLHIMILLLLILSGCTDRHEVEEQGFVLTIGVDKADKAEGYRVTFQLANPQSNGSEGGAKSAGGGYETITLFSPDISTARDILNASETRNIIYHHAKALVISEELAKSSEFFQLASSFSRDPQIRGNMYLLVSKEPAGDYLRANTPVLEKGPHRYYDFISKRWAQTALVPVATLQKFLQETEGDAGLASAIYTTSEKNSKEHGLDEDDFSSGELEKEGGTPVQSIGSAVFKNGKMAGNLTGEEVRLSSFLGAKHEPSHIRFTIPDPLDSEKRVSLEVTNSDTKISINTSSSIPLISVTPSLELNIISIPSLMDYAESIENQELLESAIKKRLTDRSNLLIQKTKELGGEPFKWSLIARKSFFTLHDYQKYNWMKSYQVSKVSIHYKIRIKYFGKRLQPIGEKEVTD